ncbi:hypothetical protein [Patulibacter sp.]|uniref:hypothetical protein n=1 Tax=Patulibacter sp. TaxID=1912859 RepID=UPI00271E70D9|nr:hypothetical protein [Patulibacter sp.]MDO9409999.1 hypothetical protein [Patulibacter sp.]
MSSPGPSRRRALLVLAALVVLVVGVAAGRLTASDDGGVGPSAARTGPTPSPSADRGDATRAVRPPTLAVGLVTTDAGALTPPATPVAGFGAAQAVTDRIAPRFVRVDVRWDLLQPAEGAPLDPARVIGDGCGREGAQPCSGAISLARTLGALKAAQAAHPGHFRPLISFWGMPAWAGAAGEGCEAAKARDGARPLAPGREPAYRAAVAAVWAAVRAAGIQGADWTPWNEPNAPYFLDPQRASCSSTAEARSPAQFSRLVVAMDAELDRLRAASPAGSPERGDRLVVGELAAWGAPSRRAVPADEFLRALPDDVLCRADVLSVHGYLEAQPRSGKGEPIAAGLRELDRRPCLDGRPAWITETAVGAPRSGGDRDAATGTLRAECRLMDRQLDRWYHDPRVTAAFQYSVREDPAFPTGLLPEDLSRTFPVADVWAAWGGSREPGAAAPALPEGCAQASDGAGEQAPPG